MALTVEAVYENGVLKLKERLPFAEHETLQVTVQRPNNWVQETAGILGWKESAEMADRFATDVDLAFPPSSEEP